MHGLLLAAALAAGGLAVGAAASPVSEAFGNTIVSTYRDGRTAEIWLKADGTYSGEGRKRDMSNGTWRMKGSRICFHQIHPAMFLISRFCTALPTVSVGQSWQGRSPLGEPTRIKLVEGHVHGA